MGLNATGDEFCRRGDLALQGLTDVEKVVDDILIHTNGDIEHHTQKVIEVLERCRKHRITLSKEKFVFASDHVEFAGYTVSSSGISIDDAKIAAIKKFPPPTNISGLRSFLGLVNQFGAFSMDLANAAAPLRPLLKKGASDNFIWTPEAHAAFEEVKRNLSAPPLIQPFDRSSDTYLHTDASRNGLGFALLQRRPDSSLTAIQYGSRFVTEAESRYAITELEMLAVTWAINKCRLYLAGLPDFTVVVDHRPLVPILNSKGLDAIENPRLLRLKQKLLSYSFHTEWVQGKLHTIPDVLSRFPVSAPTDDDLELDAEFNSELEVRVNTVVTDFRHDNAMDNTRDFLLEDLEKAARTDPQYSELVRLINQEEFPPNASQLSYATQPYFKLRHDLTTTGPLALYNGAIIVPTALRPTILRRLHSAHQGIERTRRRAHGNVFWPGISADIKNTVEQCIDCQRDRPSLPSETTYRDAMPSRPFQEVSADFFEYGGKPYMVYVCRYSGWIEIHRFEKLPNTQRMIQVLRRYFAAWGIPQKFRSDNGPQFSSKGMRDFCSAWGINHVFSAPHFPSSNGIAESAVRTAKHIVATSAQKRGGLDSEEFLQAMLELRNTPRTSGTSPAQLVFGSPMRTLLPTLARETPFDQIAEGTKTTRGGRDLPPLCQGTPVWIQNPKTREWDTPGIVTDYAGRNYLLFVNATGRTIWRNRRHIRPKGGLIKRRLHAPNVSSKKQVTFA